MRILLFLPSTGYGGAERIAIGSAKEYAASGHDVTLVFDHEERNAQIIEDVKDSPIRMLKACVAAKNYFKNNKLNNAWVIINVIRTIIKAKPDIIVLHLTYFNVGHQIAYASLKANKKIIIIYHSAPAVFKPNPVYAGLVKKYLNKKLFLVAVSENNRLNIAESFGLKAEQVSRIYNGIRWGNDFSRNIPVKRYILNDYGITSGHIVFTTIARLDVHKGFFEVIYAAAKLIKRFHHIRFLWIGDGPQKKEFEDAIKKYHLDGYIIFGGSSDKVNEILDASDFFLFPTHFEGLSLALLEAVSRKIPVITSDANSNVEVIANEDTGLVFTTFDSCDLLEKMEWAILNNRVMEGMAEKAFSRSKHIFEIGDMVSQQLNFYSEIVQGKQPYS